MRKVKTENNALRHQTIKDFRNQFLNIGDVRRVAIVGGSLSDHEVFDIKESFPDAIFEVYGIESNQNFMDLNLPTSIREKYDLVLCTNVLEHVWNHENFAQNLVSLLDVRGILWCAFPFNDMYHNSPHYYSAGFDPEYVERLFARNLLTVEESRVISSRRLYLFTHLLRDWPSHFRYKHPFVGQILWGLGLRNNPRPPIWHLSPHRLLICLYLSITPKKFHSNPTDGCGAWVKARRVESE
jgi:SAM-dependent methyltransferase